MPRSKTATECDVFAVISFAIKRPVQPPPMMATSTGLRLVMREPRFPSPLLFGVQLILPRPADVVEVCWDLQQTEPNEFRRDSVHIPGAPLFSDSGGAYTPVTASRSTR